MQTCRPFLAVAQWLCWIARVVRGWRDDLTHAETRVVLRHLTPATSYTFTVQAHDFSGNAATSNAVP